MEKDRAPIGEWSYLRMDEQRDDGSAEGSACVAVGRIRYGGEPIA